MKGTHVDRRRHALRIDSFAGTRKIIDFEAYPLQYMRDQNLRETWITRGKRYMKLLRQVAPQCRYKGFVFTKQESNKEMKERHFVRRIVFSFDPRDRKELPLILS